MLYPDPVPTFKQTIRGVHSFDFNLADALWLLENSHEMCRSMHNGFKIPVMGQAMEERLESYHQIRHFQPVHPPAEVADVQEK